MHKEAFLINNAFSILVFSIHLDGIEQWRMVITNYSRVYAAMDTLPAVMIQTLLTLIPLGMSISLKIECITL